METEGGDVHGKRVPHVEVKKHGVGGDEECERLAERISKRISEVVMAFERLISLEI